MWIRYADLWMKLAVGGVVLALGGMAVALFVFSGADSDPRSVPTAAGRLGTPTPLPPALKAVTFNIAAASQRRFAWPADGTVRRYFGTAGSTGIDVLLDPAADSPIRAGAAGRVIFAAGNPCCEYGNAVIVDHGNGFTTLYGHLSEILVSFGQHVEQGDWVGLGGSSGSAPVKQVHFELRRGNEYLDPLRFLSVEQGGGYAVQTARCPSEPFKVDAASEVTFTFLPSAQLEFQVESAKLVGRGSTEGAPALTTQVRSEDAVWLDVPEALSADGNLYRFTLETVLQQGDSKTTVFCTVELTTRRTLENPPEPVASAPSAPRGPVDEDRPSPPAPTPTPTPKAAVAKSPTAAPTSTAAPGSPTPRGPQGIKSPTPRPRPTGR